MALAPHIMLTRFEVARIIGERAEQINRGSPIFITTRHEYDTAESIAYREMLERKIPIIIKRKIPANPPYDVKIRVSEAHFTDNFIRNTKSKIEELRQQRREVTSMILSNT